MKLRYFVIFCFFILLPAFFIPCAYSQGGKKPPNPPEPQPQDVEKLTISTYFPSPYGSYNIPTLYPHDDYVPNSSCSTQQEGEMYFDKSDDNLYICSGVPLKWQLLTSSYEVRSSSGTQTKEIPRDGTFSPVRLEDAPPGARFAIIYVYASDDPYSDAFIQFATYSTPYQIIGKVGAMAAPMVAEYHNCGGVFCTSEKSGHRHLVTNFGYQTHKYAGLAIVPLERDPLQAPLLREGWFRISFLPVIPEFKLGTVNIVIYRIGYII